MTPLRNGLLTCLAVAILTTSAVAQDLLPLVEDAATHENLPADQVFDIRGLRLLANPAEIEAALSAFPSSDYDVRHDDDETRGLRDRRGNKVLFQYGRANTTIKNKSGRPYEEIFISYTSAMLGSRVHTISWHSSFDDDVDIAALKANVLEKYGDPNFRDENKYGVKFRYIFAGGSKLQANDDFSRTPQMKECHYTSGEVPWGSARRYKFVEDREKRFPGCNGEIYVEISKGQRDDLAKSISVRMWDYDLAHRNLVMQDQFLLQALDEEIASKSGAEAPTL